MKKFQKKSQLVFFFYWFCPWKITHFHSFSSTIFGRCAWSTHHFTDLEQYEPLEINVCFYGSRRKLKYALGLFFFFMTVSAAFWSCCFSFFCFELRCVMLHLLIRQRSEKPDVLSMQMFGLVWKQCDKCVLQNVLFPPSFWGNTSTWRQAQVALACLPQLIWHKALVEGVSLTVVNCTCGALQRQARSQRQNHSSTDWSSMLSRNGSGPIPRTTRNGKLPNTSIDRSQQPTIKRSASHHGTVKRCHQRPTCAILDAASPPTTHTRSAGCSSDSTVLVSWDKCVPRLLSPKRQYELIRTAQAKERVFIISLIILMWTENYGVKTYGQATEETDA